VIRTRCQAKLAAWVNMDTEMQAGVSALPGLCSCSNGSPNCHQTRLLGCLAVWHRAGVPVFQASGSQRGTSKDRPRLGRLKLTAEETVRVTRERENETETNKTKNAAL
jgi:hypothetical protein